MFDIAAFVITGLSEAVKKLIQISQLDQVLAITATLDAAVEFVLSDEMERSNIKHD